MSGINAGQNSGTTGGITRNIHSVVHYHPNGTTYGHLNTAALEVGKWHTVQIGKHMLRASKDPRGFNIVRGSATASGGALSKRQNANAIEDMSAQFGDRNWPVANQWGQDESDNMAATVLNTDNLNGVSLCSTIADDTDADTFDMSWIFETPNKPYTEIPYRAVRREVMASQIIGQTGGAGLRRVFRLC